MGDIDENGKYVPVRAMIFSADKTEDTKYLHLNSHDSNQQHTHQSYSNNSTSSSHTNSNSISTQNTTSINHQNSQLFSTSSSRTSNHYPTNEELDFMLYLELLKRKEQREIETLKEWNKTVPWKQKNKNLTKKPKN